MRYEIERASTLEEGLRVRTTPGPAKNGSGLSTSPCVSQPLR